VVNVEHKNPQAAGALDFIGLNYYSNRHLFLSRTVEPTDQEIKTDNSNYCRYPQGIYRAIVELSQKLVVPYTKKFGHELPLYVTENGIATENDAKRSRFYHEYLYAIYKAVEDGYPVYGYLPWTLADNYEWPSLKNNHRRRYGLCTVEQNNSSQLLPKRGAYPFLAFAQHIGQEAAQRS
jgi:beta-glucosidase